MFELSKLCATLAQLGQRHPRYWQESLDVGTRQAEDADHRIRCVRMTDEHDRSWNRFKERGDDGGVRTTAPRNVIRRGAYW